MLHIRFATIFLALTVITTLAGCSQDKHTFESTVYRPTSLALIDTAGETTLWQMDIPVEHKLVVDFDRMPEVEPIWANMRPATKMSWRLYNVREPRPKQWDSMKLPGTPIKMRVTYRPAPEYPPHHALARGAAQPQTMVTEKTQVVPADAPATEPAAPTTEPAIAPATEPAAPTTEPAIAPADNDESKIPPPSLE